MTKETYNFKEPTNCSHPMVNLADISRLRIFTRERRGGVSCRDELDDFPDGMFRRVFVRLLVMVFLAQLFEFAHFQHILKVLLPFFPLY